jgi:hypothetical protein
MSNIYVGLDVHQSSLTLPVLPAAAPVPCRVDQLPNDLGRLHRYLVKVAEGGPIQVCYEANGSWFGSPLCPGDLGIPLCCDRAFP